MASARKRKTIVEETIPEGEVLDGEQRSELDVALESVEDLEALRGVLEQFGVSGAVLKIYRQTPQGPSFCFQSDTLDEGFIQQNYGGGDFVARIFINGRFKSPIKFKLEPPAHNETNGNGNGNGSRGHTDFLEKLVLAMVQKEASGGSAGPTITELTGALANLDGLRGKSETAMETFLKGCEFAKTMFADRDGAMDWKSQLISTAKEILPGAVQVLSMRGNPNGVRPAVVTNPENTAAVPQITEEQQKQMIQQGIHFLKRKCLQGTDTQLIVDWVVDNSEDYQMLIQMIVNLPFEKFVEIDAQLGGEPFQSWFTELFNGLRSAFVTPNPVEPDTSGDVGNDHNAGSNGKSGKDTKRKSK